MYRKKYSAVCLLLLVLLWLLSACGNSKSEKYSEAVSLMENNNYNEAIEIFTELADYEDASAKLSECKYALGQEAITAEEWKTAISYFANLNYKDSKVEIYSSTLFIQKRITTINVCKWHFDKCAKSCEFIKIP